jgi:hypothetical protein
MPLDQSIEIARVLDEVRSLIGLSYGADVGGD